MFTDNLDNINDNYQDVVINLWKAFPQFKGTSKVSTWVYRIALNTCITQFRKHKRGPQTMSITYDVETMMDDSEEYRSNVRELYNLIGKLPPLDKALIMLWLDGKSYDEMSEVIGISKTNVGAKLTRIKEKLKKMSND